MLRPGWFSLRVLAVTAVSFGVLAPASFAQAVSLDGESLESTLTVPGQQTTFDNFTCDKAGTTTVNFTSAGVCVRPLLRHVRRDGQLHDRPADRHEHRLPRRRSHHRLPGLVHDQQHVPRGNRDRDQAALTDGSDLPTLAAFGSCDPTGSSPPNDVVAAVSDPNLVYSAQINASTGSRTDSGTSGVAIRSMPPIPGLITFTEGFNYHL